MKAERVGQVWEVGNRVYLVVCVRNITETHVTYDGLVLVGSEVDGIAVRPLQEYGDGQWEKMLSQTRLA